MDSVYANSRVKFSTVENRSQIKGISTEEQEREVAPPKWTKVLLILLGFSLILALGGLCAIWGIYNHKLEAQEFNSTVMIRELEEHEANYTRVKKQLLLHVALKKEFNDLSARYNTLRNFLSFYDAQFCHLSVDGWIACRGKLYFFSSNKLNWQSSRDACLSKGADLVTITSQSEQDFLVSKNIDIHWIGLNDLDTEGHWVWVNNKTLNETGVEFWFTGDPKQPNNNRNKDPSGENCAYLGKTNGSWYDTSCITQKTFICEKEY